MQENMGYILLGLVVAWMLWQRLLAPMLSGVKRMSAADYMKFRRDEHTLIDVRTRSEWNSGHPDNAIHLPLDQLGAGMDRLDRAKPLVVICASGSRSAMAAAKLAKAGFSPVYNFTGGMGAWRSAGLPVS